jgi:peptidoglycan/xylan/chitin deacetylase (PgdA/CDA1 family)
VKPASSGPSRSDDARGLVANLIGRALWRMPARFALAKLLGPPYSLRCVLFHDISDQESPFTRGLGVTVSAARFQAALEFLARHYTPVRLSDVLAASEDRPLPPRPVLVTFDDGYASVARVAAPLCQEAGIAPVYFLSAAYLDGTQLAMDNLVCYVVNVLGLPAVAAAARVATGRNGLQLHSMAEVFSTVLPGFSPRVRGLFKQALLDSIGVPEADLARQASLYVDRRDLPRLTAGDCELGNHTYTHVHCRSLPGDALHREIGDNGAALEALCGKPVRSFSVPYGSSGDLTGSVTEYLDRSGHAAVFLSESSANHAHPRPRVLDRVSIHAGSDEELFAQIEVLPRLRALRKRSSRTAPAGAEKTHVC